MNARVEVYTDGKFRKSVQCRDVAHALLVVRLRNRVAQLLGINERAIPVY